MMHACNHHVTKLQACDNLAGPNMHAHTIDMLYTGPKVEFLDKGFMVEKCMGCQMVNSCPLQKET